jgi:hypothetical protein
MSPLGGLKSGLDHSGEWAEYCKRLRPHPLAPIFPPFRAPPDPIDSFRIFIQFLFSGGSKPVNAPSFLAFRFDKPLVLELLERWVNGSRAGAIESSGPIRKLFNELVTVLRPFPQKR